jgi:hypothetical protein
MTATLIGLRMECAHLDCADWAWRLYRQLRDGYEECAVLPLEGVGVWNERHRTARKRAGRAVRRGYKFHPIQRHLYADDIYRVNTSATHRQGRRMSDGYMVPPPTIPLPDYRCQWHGVHCYGVTHEGTLVAYAFIYRAGELALVSQILGHADHLEAEVMYLLVQGVVLYESPLGGFLVYNRFDSGTDGLRFFKTRCGFDPTPVEWSQW